MSGPDPLDATRKRAPKWSLRAKPEMIIGGVVPSWAKQIPGPKYAYSTNNIKEKAPVYTMREKPEMVVGDSAPSWTKRIPGPKYAYDANTIKEKAPVFSMPGRGDNAGMVGGAKLKTLSKSVPYLTQDQMKDCTNVAKDKAPSFSMKSRPKIIPGAQPVDNKVPGPGGPLDTDKFKRRQPTWHIAAKLPTEADIMKTRSPGPVYGGTAIDAKLQAQVDSTKKKTISVGFGVGPRWGGTEYELVRSGAAARYNRPR